MEFEKFPKRIIQVLFLDLRNNTIFYGIRNGQERTVCINRGRYRESVHVSYESVQLEDSRRYKRVEGRRKTYGNKRCLCRRKKKWWEFQNSVNKRGNLEKTKSPSEP